MCRRDKWHCIGCALHWQMTQGTITHSVSIVCEQKNYCGERNREAYNTSNFVHLKANVSFQSFICHSRRC